MTDFRPLPVMLRMPVRALDERMAAAVHPVSAADVFHLDGTVTDNNIDGIDPTIQVRAGDGRNCIIELAGHARNRQIGLTGARIATGDRILVLGLRSPHVGENRIKASLLTLGGDEFALTPGSSET